MKMCKCQKRCASVNENFHEWLLRLVCFSLRFLFWLYSILCFLLNYLDVVFLRVWDWVMCLSFAAVFDKNAGLGLHSKPESDLWQWGPGTCIFNKNVKIILILSKILKIYWLSLATMPKWHKKTLIHPVIFNFQLSACEFFSVWISSRLAGFLLYHSTNLKYILMMSCVIGNCKVILISS